MKIAFIAFIYGILPWNKDFQAIVFIERMETCFGNTDANKYLINILS